MPRRTRVAINGRFLTMPVTGVQRFARELLGALFQLEAVDAVAIIPPRSIIELDGHLPIVEVSERWSGRDGHFWEQVTLPVLTRRSRADLLLSPCNWGPVGCGHSCRCSTTWRHCSIRSTSIPTTPDGRAW